MMRGGGSAFGAGMRRGRGEGWGEAGFPFLHEYVILYFHAFVIYPHHTFLSPVPIPRLILGVLYIFLYSLVYLLSTSHITPYYLYFWVL